MKVPVHDKPAESLIGKPKPPLEGCKRARANGCASAPSAAPRASKTAMTILTTKFPTFLQEVRETNLISIHTIGYEQFDVGVQKIMTDYGVLIIYRG